MGFFFLSFSFLLLCCGIIQAISLKSLSLWNCRTVGDQRYLVQDYSVLCSGPTYVATSVFNALFTIVVTIGWPAFLLWYLRRIWVAGRMEVKRIDERIGMNAMWLQFLTHSASILSIHSLRRVNRLRLSIPTIQARLSVLGCG
jgi:hypothetical protein